LLYTLINKNSVPLPTYHQTALKWNRTRPWSILAPCTWTKARDRCGFVESLSTSQYIAMKPRKNAGCIGLALLNNYNHASTGMGNFPPGESSQPTMQQRRVDKFQGPPRCQGPCIFFICTWNPWNYGIFLIGYALQLKDGI